MPEPIELQPNLSRSVNQAILRGMALNAIDRPATIEQWLALLSTGETLPPLQGVTPTNRPRQSTETASTVAVVQARTPTIAEPQEKSGLKVILLVTALSGLTLAGVTGGALWFQSRQKPVTEVATTPSIAPSISPTPEESPSPSPKPSASPTPTPIETPTPTPEPVPSASLSPTAPPPPKPVGRIPGFPTGTTEQEVVATLGQPNESKPGYWGDTRSVLYEVVPDRITLAYLYDRASGRVRQTEASFAPSVDDLTIQVAVNGMMSSQASPEIISALKRVYRRQTNQYSFQQGNLQGVIERNNRDRVYVGVWEADLH
jgi:serine/threonine-protein kinase